VGIKRERGEAELSRGGVEKKARPDFGTERRTSFSFIIRPEEDLLAALGEEAKKKALTSTVPFAGRREHSRKEERAK